MSSWRPNPNAKPFTPASAYFIIPLPCKRQPIRVRKKGIFSRAIQWILVFVLCVTVVINLVFIYDTTRKFNKQSHEATPQTGEGKLNDLEKPGELYGERKLQRKWTTMVLNRRLGVNRKKMIKPCIL